MFFAGRHGDMVLQDCPLLMLAQGQTWSFTPVSAWRGERPPIRHRSRRATFPHLSPGGGEGLRAALGAALIWHLQSLRRGAHCEPASFLPPPVLPGQAVRGGRRGAHRGIREASQVFAHLDCRLGRSLGNVPPGRSDPFSKGLQSARQRLAALTGAAGERRAGPLSYRAAGL